MQKKKKKKKKSREWLLLWLSWSDAINMAMNFSVWVSFVNAETEEQSNQ
jgi:hypothetical protein